MMSEFQDGITIIDSLLQTNSATNNDALNPHQRNGLCHLREILLIATSSLPSGGIEGNTTITNTELTTTKRPYRHKKVIEDQETNYTNDPTNQYLSTIYGGSNSKISKFQIFKNVLHPKRVFNKLQKIRMDCRKNEVPTAIITAATTTTLHQKYPFNHAPPEWYQLDRETQLKLSNHLSWKNLMKWDFDIFEVSDLCHRKPLVFVGWAILASPHSQYIMEETLSSGPRNLDDDDKNSTTDRDGYNFLGTYKIDPKCMIDFLRAIEDRYLHDNPYHNNTHAADVLQTTHSFLEGMGAKYLGSERRRGGKTSLSSSSMTTLQMFSILVGAVIHDVGHPGYNNAFQSNSFSQIALTYNDNSVLENHHISLAFQMILGANCNPDFNIFKGMNPNEFVKCKRLITEAILDTDMTFHFTKLDEIKKLVSPTSKDEKGDKGGMKSNDNDNDEDVSLSYSWKIMKFLMHMADISNLAKRKSISIRWTNRVLSEFFRQGDREKESGLPISPLCDRTTTSRSDSQMGFINYIVRPSFQVLQHHLPRIGTIIIPLIEANYKLWKTESHQEKRIERKTTTKAKNFANREEQGNVENIIMPRAA